VYLRRHLVLEPWSTASPGIGTRVTTIAPEQCPDCGADAGSGDSFCRSCGASLEPRVTTRA
jgi:predicted amidophosphoribosyltransferase